MYPENDDDGPRGPWPLQRPGVAKDPEPEPEENPNDGFFDDVPKSETLPGISDSLPRGIRNKNPGNIERTGTQWQGMAEDQSGDSRFIVFKDPIWGIRALAKVLLTYYRKREAEDGSAIDTVQEVIARWAPSSENDVGAYAGHVRELMGVRRGQILDLEDPIVLYGMVAAIILHENGIQPYSPKLIRRGIALAV